MSGSLEHILISPIPTNGLFSAIQWRETHFEETQVYLFIGAFLFVFIFAFVTAIASKRLDFLFYSFYSLCLLLYLGVDAYQIDENFYAAKPLLYMWFYSVLQILINMFYVLFAKHYLETFKHYPKLDKAINIIVVVLFVFIALEALLNFTSRRESHLLLMNIHRAIMSVFGICAFVYLLKYAKNALAHFIVIGSFAFLAGALAMLFTKEESYMMAGSAIEVLLFGFGLNYKLRLINREKILLEQSAHDNQMSALRAQMNPHFIFNSLNSIQYLISSDKKAPAMKYLNKFSILMRRLLEGSIKINVVLAEEIALLEKYIELEALRFNHSFTYRITTEDRLDIQEVELPPLIVQPFVENAILHGLGNKEKGEKHLDVRFMKNEKFLICEIEDNGVGREYSQKTKSSLYKSKTSRGIGVTEKRLRLLGASDRKLVEFIDKTDENGKPTGTLAIIKIPLEQN